MVLHLHLKKTLPYRVSFKTRITQSTTQKKAIVMLTVWCGLSLADRRINYSTALRKALLSSNTLSGQSPTILTMITIGEYKLKQIGCLLLNSGKHPWWQSDYSISSQCPKNWAHIILSRFYWHFSACLPNPDSRLITWHAPDRNPCQEWATGTNV